MKYLITGGAGFIGINLVQKLLKNKSNKIYIIDNFSKKNSKNINNLFENKNVTLIQKNLNQISGYLKVYNFDYIFHFAAILGVKKVMENPLLTLEENILTTIELIKFSKKQKKLKKLCFTSTSEVYSYSLKKKLAKYPTPENVDFLLSKDFNPRSSYLLSKIVGEYLLNYSGLNYVIFRPHNIFGPNMGFVHVIPELTKKILLNKPSNVMVQNSNHKRTFCFIDFAIDLMFNISHDKKIGKQIYNIGSPEEEISIFNLANKIKKILNSKKIFKISNLTKSNSPEKRKPNMKKSLKYSMIDHNFDKGLIETVLWYKNFYEN
jgi:UDP-glucose 4-epimerase